MLGLARLTLAAALTLAFLSQPLALDACSVSCEAARAARQPAVAAPCHHSTSCATQISQPTAPGSTVAVLVLAPPLSIVSLDRPVPSAIVFRASADFPSSSGPPIHSPLRI
ncbi:MAG: hypothetical protein JOZ54_01815 [Acidobacteria bacterium]|nr:hypothetical protein [Acidobacteriota bacterium]